MDALRAGILRTSSRSTIQTQCGSQGKNSPPFQGGVVRSAGVVTNVAKPPIPLGALRGYLQRCFATLPTAPALRATPPWKGGDSCLLSITFGPSWTFSPRLHLQIPHHFFRESNVLGGIRHDDRIIENRNLPEIED